MHVWTADVKILALLLTLVLKLPFANHFNTNPTVSVLRELLATHQWNVFQVHTNYTTTFNPFNMSTKPCNNIDMHHLIAYTSFTCAHQMLEKYSSQINISCNNVLLEKMP